MKILKMASTVRMFTILERISSNIRGKHQNFISSRNMTLVTQPQSIVKYSNWKQTRNMSHASSANSFTYRTHTCGEINIAHEGKPVTICGWLQFQRMGLFATLKDAYGVTQLLIPPANTEAIDLLRNMTFESVVKVTGVVKKRPDGQENPVRNTSTDPTR